MTAAELRTILREELERWVEPRLVSVAQAAAALGIAESRCWQLVGSGQLRSIKDGRRRLVPVAALDEWVAGRSDNQEGAA